MSRVKTNNSHTGWLKNIAIFFLYSFYQTKNQASTSYWKYWEYFLDKFKLLNHEIHGFSNLTLNCWKCWPPCMCSSNHASAKIAESIENNYSLWPRDILHFYRTIFDTAHICLSFTTIKCQMTSKKIITLLLQWDKLE